MRKVIYGRVGQPVFTSCVSQAFYRNSVFVTQMEIQMNIYVGNLSYSVTSDMLGELFSQHGDVASARVIMDRETNRSKGFGFVEMDNNDDATRAMEALNNYELQGRALRLNEAQPREPRQFNNGGGRGYGR